ncbi:MAG: SulP family inorganic anion transporter [Actinomycetes bacterium]
MTRPRGLGPTRGDLLAAVTVALVLVPQSLAYAQLAGLPPVNGLYVAIAAPLAASAVASSPYLQTGPVALTSLLTAGALAALAEAGSADYVGLAALLALLVGAVRLALGLLRAGAIAYLMSDPVVRAFTVTGAFLILASQVPAMLGAPGRGGNPLTGAARALADPGSWHPPALGYAAATLALVMGARRLGPFVPGALIATVAALAVATWTGYDGPTVGTVPAGLPPLGGNLPWGSLPALLLPGLVIATVGFAEPAAVARHYAVRTRSRWDPDRELVSQGLANLASGVVSGYPAGGSFSRTALAFDTGAATRWSGALTGLVVAALLPLTPLLSGLPSAVLAAVVVAAVTGLIRLGTLPRLWHLSRPQFGVAVVTGAAVLALAPRLDVALGIGVACALAVHLWRELRVDVVAELRGGTLRLAPSGVLYFLSAPTFEERVLRAAAAHPGVARVELDLRRLGRIDVTGALALRTTLDALRADRHVVVTHVPDHARRLVGPADRTEEEWQ